MQDYVSFLKSFDVVGYVFNGDEYDLECMRDIAIAKVNANDPGSITPNDNVDLQFALKIWAEDLGIEDPSDEHSYDSGEYPKVIFRDQIDSDPEFRDVCGACHNPIQD